MTLKDILEAPVIVGVGIVCGGIGFVLAYFYFKMRCPGPITLETVADDRRSLETLERRHEERMQLGCVLHPGLQRSIDEIKSVQEIQFTTMSMIKTAVIAIAVKLDINIQEIGLTGN